VVLLASFVQQRTDQEERSDPHPRVVEGLQEQGVTVP
jgi:hypothetical protein